MKIVLVDDSPLIRQKLKTLFEERMKFNVLAEGVDGYDAIELYFKHLPDLLVTDITMPNLNGYDAIVEILKRDPYAKLLVCSAITDASLVIESLKAGARGYVNKLKLLDDFSCLESLKSDFHEALEENHF